MPVDIGCGLSPSPTLGELVQEGRRALSQTSFEPSRREAVLLLSHLLGYGEARVRARSDEPASDGVVSRYFELLRRRCQGEPVAYLFGEREFYGRPFLVDSRVLIPRPESEHLVEIAIGLDLPETPRILDIGTGSGCLAVTLALEIPGARVIATDLSLGALQVARANAEANGAPGTVRWVQADLMAAINLEPVDLVVSNPPYVAPEAAANLSHEVHDFEPHLALYAADQGRSLIDDLLVQMARARSGVLFLVEIGFDQSDWLRSAAEESQHLDLVEILSDYGGIPRIGVLRRS